MKEYGYVRVAALSLIHIEMCIRDSVYPGCSKKRRRFGPPSIGKENSIATAKG